MPFASIILSALLPSLFGQPLGGTLSVDECPFRTSEYLPGERIYEIEQDKTCFKIIAGHYSIQFPQPLQPQIMSIDSVFVTLSDGHVEKMETAVLGDGHKSEVLAALTQKFGRPTEISRQTVVISGVSLVQTVAVWSADGFVIEYDSIDGDLEHGSLTAWTDHGLEADAARLEKVNAAKVKL